VGYTATPYANIFIDPDPELKLPYIEEDDGKKFEKFQVKSLKATADLIQRNGGKTFTSLDELIDALNKEK
jgi:hypothetical protein